MTAHGPEDGPEAVNLAERGGNIELSVAPDALTSILDYGGMPLTAKVVVDAVSAHLAGVPA